MSPEPSRPASHLPNTSAARGQQLDSDVRVIGRMGVFAFGAYVNPAWQKRVTRRGTVICSTTEMAEALHRSPEFQALPSKPAMRALEVPEDQAELERQWLDVNMTSDREDSLRDAKRVAFIACKDYMCAVGVWVWQVPDTAEVRTFMMRLAAS